MFLKPLIILYRDFANGFLIAEILSRFYNSEIQMHSFDNGSGLKTKIDNWAQLEKIFKKKNLKISRKMIEDVIENKADAPIPIVQEIYQHLTEKVFVFFYQLCAFYCSSYKLYSIQKVKPNIPPSVELPNFARPTIVQIEKDAGRSAMYTNVHQLTPAERKEYISKPKAQKSSSPDLKDVCF